MDIGPDLQSENARLKEENDKLKNMDHRIACGADILEDRISILETALSAMPCNCSGKTEEMCPKCSYFVMRFNTDVG